MTEELTKRVKETIKEQEESAKVKERVQPVVPVKAPTQHFIISSDDMDKIQEAVNNAVNVLGQEFGIKRIDIDVPVGEDFTPLEVCGYWFGNIMRIDLEVKK